MSRQRKVVISASVAILATLLLVPFVPTRWVVSPDPSLTVLHLPLAGGNIVGWSESGDSSGKYWFYTLNETACNETTCYVTVAMNVTAFERLQRDLNSTSPLGVNSTSIIQGSVILTTTPQKRCSPNVLNGSITCMTCSPANCSPLLPCSPAYCSPSITSGFESVAYLLLHHGAVYSNSKYSWG